MRRALAEAGSDCAFRHGVAVFETLGVKTSFKTIERVSERVGAEVASEIYGPVASLAVSDEAPLNPPELLVIEGDGMRVRECEARPDTVEGTAEDSPAEAADATAEEEDSAEEKESSWTEAKAGMAIRMRPGGVDEDGERVPPEVDVQTCLATMADAKVFAEKLLLEARRKGLDRARVAIGLSDAGHGMPGVWEAFGDRLDAWIIDFQHVSSRLSQCAEAALGPGDARRGLHRRWEGMLYEGKLDALLREIIARAEEHAERPEAAADLEEKSPGRILWQHIMYVERWREHMDYPTYVRNGWPIASGHVEALCKRVGIRMKAANKRWKPVTGSEPMANLIACRASEDGRWARRWPAQVYEEGDTEPN
jgi:hypothetical protein